MADDQGGGLPLQGVRVVELGGIGPVPFAGQQLVNMGADVVRVDRPVSSAQDAQMDPLAHGKRSIALDLTTDDGARTARSLVARAQVVLEGFRPGVAERLGVGPVSCLADNPSLVYGRMTGWGQHGPLASVAGHDINYIGRTGALHALGRFGQPPTVPLFLIGDLGGGGMFLLAGVLAALHRAGRTGRGDVVDAAIVDGVAQLMTPVYAGLAAGEWVDERGMNLLDSGRPWYDVYETADGLWMSVGAIEDKFYAEFVRLLGIEPERAGRADPAGWPALREAIAARFASRPRAYWQQVFDTGRPAPCRPRDIRGYDPARRRTEIRHVGAAGRGGGTQAGSAHSGDSGRLAAHPRGFVMNSLLYEQPTIVSLMR
jgi:alpha-methylacyl-CoA racemase